MPEAIFLLRFMHPLRRHIEAISPLTDEEFEYILHHFIPRTLRKNQYLLQEGDRVPNEYFVMQGCLKAYYTSEDGKDNILQFAAEDWWVSDYRAFFQQQPSHLNIECFEQSELLCLSLSNREKLCAEMHKMEHFFRIKLSNAVVALQSRVESLLTHTAQERYEQFITLYPHFVQRIPKKYIAAYLGVSRETLSRLSS